MLVAYQKYCFDDGGDLGAPPLKRTAEGSISQEVSSELPSRLMYGVTQGILGWHVLTSVITMVQRQWETLPLLSATLQECCSWAGTVMTLLWLC